MTRPIIAAIAFVFASASAQILSAQTSELEAALELVNPMDSVEVATIHPDDPIIAAMDSMWVNRRMLWQNPNGNARNTTPAKDASTGEGMASVPDSIIAQRLEVLNRITPLDLDYNPHVRAYINVYVERRRELSERVLGLSQLYYPLFEEIPDQFNIPLELKHLAVVESALNPVARSRVGASGLWQFMYNTGRMYGLEVDSYIDQRSDPYESTVAACRYMSFLYGMYGDWNLVLAAYNSGPGNVNKAIRRSGGHRDYRKIRPYLPRETRGYVPAFIAVNYMMNYAEAHDLHPAEPTLTYSEVDTLRICRETTFASISKYTGIETAELELLNPLFKRNFIPETPTCHTLYLPISAIGEFLANEDSIFGNPETNPVQVVEEEVVADVYTVRRGDVLGVIANRYNVRLSDLREWNNIHGNRIYPGQKLEIRGKAKTTSSASTASAAKQAPEQRSDAQSTDYRYHVVETGDTLWDIAKKYPGISVDDLKSVNSGVNHSRLKPGQKIKIPPAS